MTQCRGHHQYFGRCELQTSEHDDGRQHQASTFHEVTRTVGDRSFTFEVRRINRWDDSDKFAGQWR